MDFFSTELTFQPTRWLLVTAKVSTTDTYGLAPLQVWERAVMDTVLIWLPIGNVLWKFWLAVNIMSNIWTTRFWNIFSGSSSTTNEPNFKIVCNCIHELLNVFEGSAQREHTITSIKGVWSSWSRSIDR